MGCIFSMFSLDLCCGSLHRHFAKHDICSLWISMVCAFIDTFLSMIMVD